MRLEKEAGQGRPTNHSEKRAEQYCQENEPSVPFVAIVDCRDSQKHEDNRLRRAAQHFQGIFYCCVGLAGYVGLHIVLHRDATESYAGENICENYHLHTCKHG